ncbi:hypothetical protein K461DRAFT_329262 [Myriangium duriaei CBS 260.36]|uniref:Uncharacterized protein n=1 Tax=Myriangium duriaei CBS 260.36 TaxID=1168546 RepID=A0A9P4MDQ1_9PEZI|nr:hypothetical protein K461DRAFT_329262 [Myriangium duriaei CBS 260.36]
MQTQMLTRRAPQLRTSVLRPPTAGRVLVNKGITPIQRRTQATAVDSIAPSFEAPLNIPAQCYKPEFHNALRKIMTIRQQYLEDRAVFVQGKELVPLLIALGAREEDIAGMKTVSERLWDDPTLPFRKSRNGRFCLDWDTRSLRRLEFQPFALSLEEDFKRHDSGQIRIFDEIENDLQLNSVFQALLAFKSIVMHGVPFTHRHNLDYSVNKWVSTVFNLRTVTTPNMLGEPALEGVHTDGVDHTMTTFLGAKNMAPNSAVTFMHDMAETTGSHLSKTTVEMIRARIQHKSFLDTLMIVDNERKHSISPVYAVDPTKEATRDMLIFFTRKPVEKRQKDHVSGSIDSFRPHTGKPMEVPLHVPGPFIPGLE